jgi:antitoxin ParD1/3/4
MKRSASGHEQAFVNVSMPAPLRDRLTKKVQKLGSYGSTSEYVRDLIRKDLDRDVALAKLDQFITEGANSATERVTQDWWERLDAEIERRRRARAKGREPKQRKHA